MGYNTWNRFACAINQTLIRETADALVQLGLREAGYTYLNLDDCWLSMQRSPEGQLTSDPDKFPDGMAALAEYVHSKGLKFGIYEDAGLLTCAGYPGSAGHERDDAALFASWGVDYLKYDNCWSPLGNVVERYTAMRDALNETEREVVYSMCDWGVAQPWLWGADVGNSWRVDSDISATWQSILGAIDNTAGLAKYAGPGGWNDPDMLEVGNGLLTLGQEQAHFALWAIAKAPLLIGADLRSIRPSSLSVLLASEVIAISQDPLGVAGDLVWKEGPHEVWAAPLQGGDRAVVLLNRHASGLADPITVTWQMLGYPSRTTAEARDLFTERNLGEQFSGSLTQPVPGCSVRALRLMPRAPQARFDTWRPWHVQPAVAPQRRGFRPSAEDPLAQTLAAPGVQAT